MKLINVLNLTMWFPIAVIVLDMLMINDYKVSFVAEFIKGIM